MRDRALRGALRAVHRGVRRSDQARRRVARAGTRDSDRRRDRRHAVAQRQRRGDRLDDARRDGARRVGVAEPGTEHHELVAAEPARSIGRPQDAIDPLGDDHQRLVAGGVAEAVVDLLEAVEVDEQQAQVAVGERVADELVHQPAVREAGQRVVQRPERHLALAAAARGGVADRALERARPELVTPETRVRSVLERRARHRVRRVVDDHDDRHVGRAGAQPRERCERGVGIVPDRQHEALVPASPRTLDALGHRVGGVEADARLAREHLEIELREGRAIVRDHERAYRPSDGRARIFFRCGSRYRHPS